MKLNVMSEQTACLMDSWVKDWSGNITEKGKNENVVEDIFLHKDCSEKNDTGSKL